MEDLADVIRAWGKQTKDPEISQQDCDWLAYEIEEAMEEKRLIELKQDKGLVGSLLHMFRGTYSSTYGDARNPDILFDKITDEMLIQHHKVSNPVIGITPRERLSLIERNVKDPFKLVQATLHPKPYTRQDLAGLIGESMKPVLKQHHQEMLVVNREEIQQRDNHRKALDRALDPFLRLDSAKNRLSGIEYDKLNQPTTASDFVKSVMMDTVTGAEIKKQKEELDEQYDVTPETTTEERNRIFDTTDYGERLVELNRAVIFNTETAEKSIMDEVLPVMDDFTAFYEEMKALQNQEGGLKSADPEKLLALDLKARDLRERAPLLSEHAVNLLQKYGTEGDEGMGPVREFCLGMHYAADRIMAATSTYMKAAGSRERLHQHDMAELEKLNKEFTEISGRLMTSLEELGRLERAPKVPWATPDLQSVVRLLPELGEHLSKLDGQTDPLLANARSIEDLMEPLLGRPLMSRLFGEEMDNALKTEHHIQQAHSIAQSRADVIGQQIDTMLKPSIREFDSFLELRGEISDLAMKYPNGGIPREAQDRIGNALGRAEVAAQQLREHMATLEERYGEGKEVAFPLLREIATRVESLVADARGTLEQLSKLGETGGPESGSSIAPQVGGKKSYNPFDDDAFPEVSVGTAPPKPEPKVEPPKAEPKKSTNPFDDGWEPPKTQTTRPEGPKSTNPFDDNWQPPTNEPPRTQPKKSTNPFDDLPPPAQQGGPPQTRPGGQKKSTNPFDD